MSKLEKLAFQIKAAIDAGNQELAQNLFKPLKERLDYLGESVEEKLGGSDLDYFQNQPSGIVYQELDDNEETDRIAFKELGEGYLTYTYSRYDVNGNKVL